MHGSYSYDTQLFKLKISQQHYLIIYLEDSSTSHIISQKGLKTRISTTPHFALSVKIGDIIAKRTSVTWVKWERYVGSINTLHEHIWNWITISSTGSISIMKLLTGLSLSWLRIQKKKNNTKTKTTNHRKISTRLRIQDGEVKSHTNSSSAKSSLQNKRKQIHSCCLLSTQLHAGRALQGMGELGFRQRERAGILQLWSSQAHGAVWQRPLA